MHWAAIVLLLFYFLNPWAREVGELEEFSQKGVECYHNEEYEEALENFLTVTKARPAKKELMTSSLFNAGCCYYYLKEYDSAIGYFKRLREEFPAVEKSKDALFYLAGAYARLEDYGAAVKSYQAFIKEKPDNVEAVIDTRFQIALCYGKGKDYAETVEVLEDLKAEYPGRLLKQRCDYISYLVYSEEEEKAVEIAERMFKQETNPWANEVCFRVGNLLFQNEKYEQAMDFYRKVRPKTEMSERLEAAQESIKKVYILDTSASGYQGWEKSTLQYLAEGIEENPDLLPRAVYQIAECYFSLGKYENAEETYAKIIAEYSEEKELIEKIDIGKALCRLKEGDVESFQEIVDEIEKEDLRFMLLQGLYRAKEYQTLIEEYKKDIFSFEEDEYKSSGLYLIADAYFEVEEFPAALELFNELAREYPESEQAKPAKFRSGQCLLKLKKYEEAISIWEELLEIYPEQAAEITYMLGYTYSCLKDYANTLRYANLFLKKYPDHEMVPDALLCKSSALMGQKKYDEAVGAARELIEKYPLDELVPMAYANIGKAYYHQGNYEKMVEIFRNLEKDYPENKAVQAQAKYWIGLYWEHKHKFKDALRKYCEIRKSYPESVWIKEVQLRIAFCYAQLRQYTKAREEYLTAIDKWWEDRDYLLRVLDDLNMVFWGSQDFKKGIEVYRQLIEKYPTIKDYLSFKLAGIYYFSGDNETASSIYRKILPLIPSRVTSLQDRYMIGEAFLKTGYYRQALDNYLEFLSLNPPEGFIGEGVKGIALCYFNLEDPSVGKKLKELIKYNPETKKLVEVNLALGKMDKLRNRFNEAIPFYRRALNRAKEEELDAWASFELAECYRYSGKYREAVKLYKRVELLYGYYEELAERSRVGFALCSKHLPLQKETMGREE